MRVKLEYMCCCTSDRMFTDFITYLNENRVDAEGILEITGLGRKLVYIHSIKQLTIKRTYMIKA